MRVFHVAFHGATLFKPGTGGRFQTPVLPPVPGLIRLLPDRGFRFAPPPAGLCPRFAARNGGKQVVNPSVRDGAPIPRHAKRADGAAGRPSPAREKRTGAAH